MKLDINLTQEQYDWLKVFAATISSREDGANTHGPLTVETLIEMLLEDVRYSGVRPGSWEGAHMIQVLSAHGYG